MNDFKQKAVHTISLNFLGTGQHREKNKHIITRFHQTMEDYALENPEIAVRLFDGPGSSPQTQDSKHPTPGTYLYNPATDEKVVVDPKISRDIDNAIACLSGTVAGEGVESLLLEATLYVNNIIQKNNGKMPKTINLQGFSRGADACLRMANILDQLYPDIDVNVFLIDQVPGPGRRNDPHSYTIPRNVKRFESALMFHEYRPGFDPQDEERYVFTAPETTKVSLKTYFGEHGAGTRFSTNSAINHTSMLVHDDLYRFAKETGSLPQSAVVPDYYLKGKKGNFADVPVINKLGLSSKERFLHYCTMRENEWLYAKGTRLNQRSILFKKEDYVANPELFINQEHRELFKTNYPKVFNWFFEKNCNQSSKEAVIAELKTIGHSHFAESLAKNFDYNLNGIETTLPEPQGMMVEERSVIGKPLIADELSYLRYSLRSIANYYQHHYPIKSVQDTSIKEAIFLDLKDAAKLPPEEATAYLSQRIEHMKTFLQKENNHGFVAQQLRRIAPDYRQYAENTLAILNDHLKNNIELISEQRDDIKNTIHTIKQIETDEALDSRQKYRAIKQEVIGVQARITEPDEQTKMHNIFNQAFHRIDEKPTHTISSLTNKLNGLSNAGYAETSLAGTIVHKLEAYTNRNTFWKTVEKIFKAIHLPFPFSFNSQKEEIAINLKEKMSTLDAEGLGNNVNAIVTELKDAQGRIRDLYATKGLFMGTLDKIVNGAMGKLSVLIGISDEKMTPPALSIK
ncbi:MAG: DUF5621 domain-containing protein [Legionella sp.]|nr:DUF5621 domain-containing protein [Legionella sp.]